VVAALVGLWIYTFAHFVATGIAQPLRNFQSDFLTSFPSWKLSRMLGRMDLYDGSLSEHWSRDPEGGEPMWNYGPVEHLVTLPLFAFPTLRSAYLAWLFVNYGFLIGIVILSLKLFDPGRSLIGSTAIVAAILNFNPLYEALTQRNIEIFEMLLVLGAFALWRRGREGWSGLLIGIAAMTKFLPLIFLPYFLIRKKWRALGAALAAIVPIAVVTELVFGWSRSWTLIQLREGSFLQKELNQSLSGALLRLIDWFRIPVSGATASRIAIGVCLIGLCWLFVRKGTHAAVDDLEWSVLLIAMVLLPPHNQSYYLLFLLFPYLAIFRRRVTSPGKSISTWWALAVSFAFVASPIPFSIVARIVGPRAFHWYMVASIPFIGAAILAWITVVELLDARAVASET